MKKLRSEVRRQAMGLCWLALSLLAASTLSFAAENRRRPQPHEAAKERASSASSIVFPLYGNVYPSGLYFASVHVGDPPKPYFLDVDTGSDLTWLQCDAPCVSCSKGPHPLYKPQKDGVLPCEHPICASLQAVVDSTASHSGEPQRPHCESPNDQCDFEVEYADHGSSRGVLVSDAFSANFLNGSLLSPRLTFGCGYDQQPQGKNSQSPTDGVLGLGIGKSSISAQLREKSLTRNVIGHCLSRRGGGFLFFGDSLVPPSISWTPMLPRTTRKYYSPGSGILLYGRQPLWKDCEVIFDSGSSYTYLAARPYELFLNAVKSSSKNLKAVTDDRTLPLCWRGGRPFKSIGEARRHFKPLSLAFSPSKRTMFSIPPENYLILTKQGSICLGVLNGTEAGLKDLNIIGDISMQDVMVVFDNEKEQIGWGKANCDRFPRSVTPTPEESSPNLGGAFFRAASEMEEEAKADAVSAPSPLPVTPDAV